MNLTIRSLDHAEARRVLPALSELLVDAVANGASVNFMAGFTVKEADIYWTKQIVGLDENDRVWLVAEAEDSIIGTVMCVFAQQPNQPFRADISKMLVHSSQRRRGIGALLLQRIEEEALKVGKTLLVLDTGAGSAGDRLYTRMGWTAIGTIPGYAYTTDGRPEGATFFYKQLAPPPVWKG
ncbi:MAG: N-acetyltransferase family protein [Beijerinckiaceae bacterium]